MSRLIDGNVNEKTMRGQRGWIEDTVASTNEGNTGCGRGISVKPRSQTLLVSFAVVSVDRDKVSFVGEISLPLYNRNLRLFEIKFF